MSKELENAFDKGIASLARIESEKELINTLAEDVEEAQGIKAKRFKELLNAAFKDDTEEKIRKLTELKEELASLKLA